LEFSEENLEIKDTTSAANSYSVCWLNKTPSALLRNQEILELWPRHSSMGLNNVPKLALETVLNSF